MIVELTPSPLLKERGTQRAGSVTKNLVITKYLKIRALARELRKNQTPAEKLFWERVRNRQFYGYKFYRQYIIEYDSFQGEGEYFIVDFFCHKKNLIIELDGPIHRFQAKGDENRVKILKSLGYKVVRFKNEEVLNNWLLVKEKLMRILKSIWIDSKS